MTRTFLLRGGRVVDPSSGIDGRADLRVIDGVVAAIGTLEPLPGERAIDVDGLIVAPGLIDVHVHLREPGQEWKETIGSGTAAAAAGGFTTVFCMPNTEPALDSVTMLEELKRRCKRDAMVDVRPIATISQGRTGRRPVDYRALAKAGAVGFSDDGESTRDSWIMRNALEATHRTGVPVMVHCEDPALIGGAMHEGDISRELGLPGITPAAEEIFIERDLALAEVTGGWLHVCHVSTARGAEAIARARRRGVHVTSEVMPHHLTMTDEWVRGERLLTNTVEPTGPSVPAGNPDAKVNPPLRTGRDAAALLQSLRNEEIDLVSTDHAPHGRPEKFGRHFSHVAFGMSGSEVALPIMLSLVRSGNLTLSDVVRTMSSTPARLWGLSSGRLHPGSPADIVVFDPDEPWTVEPDRLASRSANTPLSGMTMRGRAKWTFVGGDERHRDW
jgi:dihydroorotase